jgi:hypothetical protein
MSTELARTNGAAHDGDIVESVIVKGDLAKLSPDERSRYYSAVCRSLGINPLTRPFDYVNLSGKLTLYARKDAADQLRKINGVSLSQPHIDYMDDLVVVSVNATDKTGRTDSDLGAVSIAGLKGEARANAIMKAITKAKRRVTLSIVGLGWLDESEIEGIGTPVVVDTETGVIRGQIEHRAAPVANPEPPLWADWRNQQDAIDWAVRMEKGVGFDEYQALKAERKPKSAAAMFEAWYMHVMSLPDVAESDAVQPALVDGTAGGAAYNN